MNSRGELGRRIRDMGLVPGAAVRMEGPAPLNDPVAVRVHSFKLTLRNNEADFIEVAVEVQRRAPTLSPSPATRTRAKHHCSTPSPERGNMSQTIPASPSKGRKVYTPCVVSVMRLAKEAGGWKWGVFSMVFNTAATFLIAIAVYQCGRLFGIGI